MKKVICILLSSIFLINSLALSVCATSSGSSPILLNGSDLYYYLNSVPSSYMVTGSNGSSLRGVMETKLVETFAGNSPTAAFTNRTLIYSDQYVDPSSNSFVFNLPCSTDSYNVMVSMYQPLSILPYTYCYEDSDGKMLHYQSNRRTSLSRPGIDLAIRSQPIYNYVSGELALYNDGKYVGVIQSASRPSTGSKSSFILSTRGMISFDASGLTTFRPLSSIYDKSYTVNSSYSSIADKLKNFTSHEFLSYQIVLNLYPEDFGLEKFGELSFTMNFKADTAASDLWPFVVGPDTVYSEDSFSNIDSSKVSIPMVIFDSVRYSVAPTDEAVFLGKIDDIIENQKQIIQGQTEIKDSIDSIDDTLRNPTPEQSQEAEERQEAITSMLEEFDNIQSELEVEKPELNSDDYDFTDETWWSDSVEDVKSIFDLFTDHFGTWLTPILVAVSGLIIIRLILYGTNG